MLSAYDTGLMVTFVADRTPDDVLRILGAEPDDIFPLTRSAAEAIERHNGDPDSAGSEIDLDELDDEDLRARGFLVPDGKVVRAGQAGSWVYVIESSLPGIAREDAELLSEGTTVYSVSQTVNAAAWFTYAQDGEVRASCNPFYPQGDLPAGLDPEALRFSGAALKRVLTFLEEQAGIFIPGEADWTPLPSACL